MKFKRKNIETVNIFTIETELQYLAYVAINKLTKGGQFLIFTTSDRVYKKLIMSGSSCIFISRKSRGWVGRLNRIRRNLNIYRQKINRLEPGFSEINLHIPRLDNIHNNMLINYLKYHFRDAEINVRLIPDGAINIFSSSLSPAKIKKQKRWIKNIGFRLSKGLEYYSYSGDELGADADVVDRIYCFEGVQTGYSKEKLYMINLPISCGNSRNTGNSILVIGQNFLQLNTASQEYVVKVSNAVSKLTKDISAGVVDYAPHPRSSFNEFWNDDYNTIDDDYLCIEEKIAHGGYKHIISCYSSALINSKIILGDTIQCYSVGLQEFPFEDEAQKKKLVEAYKNLGINIIKLKKPSSSG